MNKKKKKYEGFRYDGVSVHMSTGSWDAARPDPHRLGKNEGNALSGGGVRGVGERGVGGGGGGTDL